MANLNLSDNIPGPETSKIIVFQVAAHLGTVNEQFINGQITPGEVLEQIRLSYLYLERVQQRGFEE